MSAPAKERIVRCPACGGPAVYAATNAWRPFCSQRCRGMDLGAWASEQFRVPSQGGPADGPSEGLADGLADRQLAEPGPLASRLKPKH